VKPFLGIYPKKCESGYNGDTCTLMYITELFIIAKLWKQLRCPTTDKWIKKMWCGDSKMATRGRKQKACFLK
jgi:hypothetical protein